MWRAAAAIVLYRVVPDCLENSLPRAAASELSSDSKVCSSEACVLNDQTIWNSDDALLTEVCSLAGFPGCGDNLPLASDPISKRCSLPWVNLNPEAAVPENAFHVGPLVLGNLTFDWSALQSWERSALLQEYGDVEVFAGSPKELADEGTKAGRSPIILRELLDQWRAGNHDLFLFQSNNAEHSGNCTSLGCVLNASLPQEKKTLKEFKVPESLKSMDSLIASIGPSNQGLPLHSHGGAWQALVHGKKLWVLLPPGQAEMSQSIMGRSAKELLSMSEKQKKQLTLPMFTCMQEPGEVVVVPHLWQHATLNIGDAVAIGGQIRGKMLEALLKCLQPLIEKQRVKSYEEGFAICEKRWHIKNKRRQSI